MSTLNENFTNYLCSPEPDKAKMFPKQPTVSNLKHYKSCFYDHNLYRVFFFTGTPQKSSKYNKCI